MLGAPAASAGAPPPIETASEDTSLQHSECSHRLALDTLPLPDEPRPHGGGGTSGASSSEQVDATRPPDVRPVSGQSQLESNMWRETELQQPLPPSRMPAPPPPAAPLLPHPHPHPHPHEEEVVVAAEALSDEEEHDDDDDDEPAPSPQISLVPSMKVAAH